MARGRRDPARFACSTGLDRSKGAMDPVRPDAQEALIRSLVERSRGGDQAAFRELVLLHQDRAYGLALRITRSPADAGEAAGLDGLSCSQCPSSSNPAKAAA